MISKEDTNQLKQLSAKEKLKFISKKNSDRIIFSVLLGEEDHVIRNVIFYQNQLTEVDRFDKNNYTDRAILIDETSYSAVAALMIL